MPTHEEAEENLPKNRDQAEEHFSAAAGGGEDHEERADASPKASSVQTAAKIMAQDGGDGGGRVPTAGNASQTVVDRSSNCVLLDDGGYHQQQQQQQQQQQEGNRHHSLAREMAAANDMMGMGKKHLEMRMTTMTQPIGTHVGRDDVRDGGGAMNVYRVGGAFARGGGWTNVSSTGSEGGDGGTRGGTEYPRRVVLAKKRRMSPSATATATYSWGMEPRKGGVHEKFVATVDTADMVKVWSNGDVVVNSGGKGITPATKVILNLVLGVFKVEIAESEEKGGGDSNKTELDQKKWHIEHKSGYKQTYSENMNMSLFPNRDWAYTKTRLKRLPTKIFLPKEEHFSAPAVAEQVRDEEEEEEERWQQQPRLSDAEHPSQQRRHEQRPPASNLFVTSHDSVNSATLSHDDNRQPSFRNGPGRHAPSSLGSGHGRGYEREREGQPGASFPPPSEQGHLDFVPSSAIAVAALKEGVPPHLVEKLMRAVAASGAAAVTGAGMEMGSDAVVEDLFAAAWGGGAGFGDRRRRVVGRRVSPAGEDNNTGVGLGSDFSGPGENDIRVGESRTAWSTLLPSSSSSSWRQPPVPVVSEAVVSPPRGGHSHGNHVGSSLERGNNGVRDDWGGGFGGEGRRTRRSDSSGPGDEQSRSSVHPSAEAWSPWRPRDDSQSPPSRRRKMFSDSDCFDRDDASSTYPTGGGGRRWDDYQRWLSERRRGEARRAIVYDHHQSSRRSSTGFRGRGNSRGRLTGRSGGGGRLDGRPNPSSRSRSPRRNSITSSTFRWHGQHGAEEGRRREFSRGVDSPRADAHERDAYETASKKRTGAGEDDGGDGDGYNSDPGGASADDGLGVGAGGLERGDSSYDPDLFDPNAYDPGEVTVKREAATGKPTLTRAAQQQLMDAVRRRRRSNSASSSHASRSASLTRDEGRGRRRRARMSRSRSHSSAACGRRMSEGSKRSSLESGAGTGREVAQWRRSDGDSRSDFGTGNRARSPDRITSGGSGFNADDWRRHETVGYVAPASADVDVHLPPPARVHAYAPGFSPPVGGVFHGSVAGGGPEFSEGRAAPHFAPRQQQLQHEQEQYRVQQNQPPPPPPPRHQQQLHQQHQQQQQQQHQQVLVSPQPPAGQFFQHHPEPQVPPPQQQLPGPVLRHPPCSHPPQEYVNHHQPHLQPPPPQQQQQHPMQPQQVVQQQAPPHQPQHQQPPPLVLLPHPPPAQFFLPAGR